MNFNQISKIFNNQPYVAAMLYTEKILYANKKLQELLGVNSEEIREMNPEEIFPPGETREKIKTVVQRRLKGEDFPATYQPFEVMNKNNKRLMMKFFTQTIKLDSGNFAGLVLGIDVTSEYKKEFLIDILKEINQTIISKEKEDEIYNHIITAIHNKGGYEFVCASIKEKNSFDITPKYYIGNYNDDFLNFLKTIFKTNSQYKHACVVTQYMIENKYLIINNLTEIDFPNKQLLNNLLKRNFKSILFFPIFKKNALYSSIGICSKYIDDFDKTTLSIFEEAK